MTNELIERLRLAAEDHAGGPPSVEQVEALVELVDALEAELAARQPSEDDREATEAEIDKAARVLHMAKCCSLSGDSPHDFPEASELFAAGVVLNAVPRAAVPDAEVAARQIDAPSVREAIGEVLADMGATAEGTHIASSLALLQEITDAAIRAAVSPPSRTAKRTGYETVGHGVGEHLQKITARAAEYRKAVEK